MGDDHDELANRGRSTTISLKNGWPKYATFQAAEENVFSNKTDNNQYSIYNNLPEHSATS